MVRAEIHRGPDDEGLYRSDPALSLSDFDGSRSATSPAAPSRCGTRTIRSAVVFNGEIYNHLELREELERRGHRFRSASTPTPKCWCMAMRSGGARFPSASTACSRLPSWTGRTVVCSSRATASARSRSYYYAPPGLFAFASELCPLVQHRAIEARPSLAALRKLFAYGYIPAPAALYEGSAKLPAGHSPGARPGPSSAVAPRPLIGVSPSSPTNSSPDAAKALWSRNCARS